MKKSILLYCFSLFLSILFISCTGTKEYSKFYFTGNRNFDNGDSEAIHISFPKCFFDDTYSVKFNLPYGYKLYPKPSKRFLKGKTEITGFKSKELLYYGESDYGIKLIIETIPREKFEEHTRTNPFIEYSYGDDTYYQDSLVLSYDTTFSLSSYKALNESRFIKFTFFSNSFHSNFLDYFGRCVLNSCECNFVEDYRTQINNNISAFMFNKYKQEGEYVNGLYAINNYLNDEEKEKNKYYIDTYNSFCGIYRDPRTSEDDISNEVIYVNAKEELNKIASEYDVVLFNESHLDPYCRYYVRTLLQDLRNQGYKLLGLETLSPVAHDINEFGFPILGSGFYSDDPQMANLIREASQLGFEIFTYDAHSFECDTCETPFSKMQFREDKQAENISRKINSENQKCIILAGHGHIYKDKYSSGLIPMRNKLDGLLPGKKILSVNQSTQHLYKNKYDYDVIPKLNDSTYYFSDKFKNRVDIQVIHKPDKYDKLSTYVGNDTVVIYEPTFLNENPGFLILLANNENQQFGELTIPVSCQYYDKSIEQVRFHLSKEKFTAVEFDIYGNPHVLKSIGL